MTQCQETAPRGDDWSLR